MCRVTMKVFRTWQSEFNVERNWQHSKRYIVSICPLIYKFGTVFKQSRQRHHYVTRKIFTALFFMIFMTQSISVTINLVGRLIPLSLMIHTMAARCSRLQTDNNEGIRCMIESDKSVSCQQIWKNLKIDMSSAQKILSQYLDIKELCARWIPTIRPKFKHVFEMFEFFYAKSFLKNNVISIGVSKWC